MDASDIDQDCMEASSHDHAPPVHRHALRPARLHYLGPRRRRTAMITCGCGQRLSRTVRALHPTAEAIPGTDGKRLMRGHCECVSGHRFHVTCPETGPPAYKLVPLPERGQLPCTALLPRPDRRGGGSSRKRDLVNARWVCATQRVIDSAGAFVLDVRKAATPPLHHFTAS